MPLGGSAWRPGARSGARRGERQGHAAILEESAHHVPGPDPSPTHGPRRMLTAWPARRRPGSHA